MSQVDANKVLAKMQQRIAAEATQRAVNEVLLEQYQEQLHAGATLMSVLIDNSAMSDEDMRLLKKRIEEWAQEAQAV